MVPKCSPKSPAGARVVAVEFAARGPSEISEVASCLIPQPEPRYRFGGKGPPGPK